MPEPSVRVQATDHRPGLLRDVQPRQRDAGRPAQGRRSSRSRRRASDTEQGHHDLDVIIYATGFDAMTGALTRIDVRGRDGMSLARLLGRRGSVHLPGDRGGGLPEPVHRPGAGKPFGGNELRRRSRAARRVDRRLHRLPARQRLPNHRGAAGCAARMDRAHDRAGGADRAGRIRRAIPGTTAATSPARSGCTWATRRGSRSTAGGATRSRTPATPGFKLAMRAIRTRAAHRPRFRRGAAAGARGGGEVR